MDEYFYYYKMLDEYEEEIGNGDGNCSKSSSVKFSELMEMVREKIIQEVGADKVIFIQFNKV